MQCHTREKETREKEAHRRGVKDSTMRQAQRTPVTLLLEHVVATERHEQLSTSAAKLGARGHCAY